MISGYIFHYRRNRKKLNDFIPAEFDGAFLEEAPRIVVYTVIFGKYDKVSQPQYTDSKTDYYIVTDMDLPDGGIWKKCNPRLYTELSGLSQQEKSRFFKMHPELLFKDYDYSIYIDGNITIRQDLTPIIAAMENKGKIFCLHRHSARDCIYEEGKAVYALGRAGFREVSRQLSRYRKEGMPRHFGLFENNVIARKHNEKACIKIMDTWWNEYHNGCKRDQLSFMYALWKNGYDASFVMSMGSNSRKNPMFAISPHE